MLFPNSFFSFYIDFFLLCQYNWTQFSVHLTKRGMGDAVLPCPIRGDYDTDIPEGIPRMLYAHG